MSKSLILNPTRVKKYFSNEGVNSHLKTKDDAVEEKILKMKKIGAPEVPQNPRRPVCNKDPTKEEKEKFEAELKKYEADKLKYEEAHKEWQKYKSEQFQRSKRLFKLVKLLKQIKLETDNENQTESRKKTIAELKSKLNDPQLKPQLLKDLNLKKFPQFDGYEKLCGKIISEEGDRYQILKEQEEVRHEKTRFASASMPLLTYFSQCVFRDFIMESIKSCKKNNRKTLSLDDCKPSVLESSKFYNLVRNFKTIDRVEEYMEFKKSYKEFKDDTNKQIHNIPGSKTTHQIKNKLHQKNVITFEKLALKKGYMITNHKGSKWVGLEVTESGEEYNKFATHVNKLIKRCMVDFKSPEKPTNVSHIVTCFYAKLLEEFILSVSDRVKIWKQHDGHNKQTISINTLLMLLNLMLLGIDHDLKLKEFVNEVEEERKEKVEKRKQKSNDKE